MSKALELAAWMNEGAWHQITLGQVWEIGAELRRLAQVEAEHEALLKAISDAEPVAWMSSKQLPALKDPDDEGGKYMPLRKTALGNFDFALYTLNGIKP